VNSSLLSPEGILLVDKPSGRTSFSLVALARKRTGQKKIGHAGTLDPFATGLLILLLGRTWTRKAELFLTHDKEYSAIFRLGQSTDTYDREGQKVLTSSYVPSQEQLESHLAYFQGEYNQTPPMFSAKKKDGKKLYELARKGVSIDRKKEMVRVHTTLEWYRYPDLKVYIRCSKGTYIRSIANDLGERLGCYAYVQELERTRSGPFSLNDAVSFETFNDCTPETIQSLLIEDYGRLHS